MANDPNVYFKIYRDDKDEWRWRLKHRNGNIMADSGEGYDSKAACQHGVDVMKNLSNAPVIVETSAQRLKRFAAEARKKVEGT